MAPKIVRRSRTANGRGRNRSNRWRHRLTIGALVAALLLVGGLIGAALDHAEYRHTCPEGTVQWTAHRNADNIICLRPGQSPIFGTIPQALTPQS